MDLLTIEEFKKALPPAQRKSVNPAVVNQIAQELSDPDMYEAYRENLLSYTHVMSEGKFKVTGYVSAVKYVSLKLMGKTNTVAYSITFPSKIAQWQARGMSDKDMSSHIAAYNKSKLVAKIYENTAIPSWVLNQDNYQKAINTQVELMTTARSEKVRSDAANSLLTHLKPPETTKVELDIGVKGDSAIDNLKKTISDLATVQSEAIAAGALTSQQIAHQQIVTPDIEDAEFEEVPEPANV